MILLEKDKNFSKLFHEVVDSRVWASLSPKAKGVYVVLLRYASYDSRIANPSGPKIAELSGFTLDSISDATKELMEKGLIEKKRGGPKIGFRNIYIVKKTPALSIQSIIGTLGEKPLKCPSVAKDPKSGKFIRKKTQGKTPNSISGGKTNNDEKVEIKEIEIGLGSALACPKGQASPGPIKNQKTLERLPDEIIHEIRESMGEDKLRQYLLDKGYAQEEVENRLNTTRRP